MAVLADSLRGERFLCALAYGQVPSGTVYLQKCPGRCPGTQFSPKIFESKKGNIMNSIIYIVGLVVVVIAVLSFFGLR
jgi:hypothetical protein